MSIYNFKVKDIKGSDVSLSEYKGKVLLVVNTASKCGFTPQYTGLEELYKKYKDNFVVLAFPCNQFGAQEPGSNDEIASFCDLSFKTSFPLFSKIDVNGKDTDEFYKFLKNQLPGLMGTEKIKWNFTKFLIDKNGNPIKRFAPQVKPSDLESEIQKLIND